MQHIPVETVRFEKLDDSGQFSRVAIHPDWGRRFTANRKWKKEDIEFIDLFNPDPTEIKKQVDSAGGWENYKGQVFYFSNQGEKVYPKPIFDSILTDMSTEEGIANVSNRNARNNFLAAGMFIDKKADNDSPDLKKEEGRIYPEEKNDTEKALEAFQGDESACKMLYIQVESEDEKPEFVSFKGTNYDKEFNITLESAQSNIGKVFSQPPILRAEDVGANFGADLMKNSYDFYNSVTQNERLILEMVLRELFSYWYEPLTSDFSILPLTYETDTTPADRLGKDNLSQMVAILNSANSTYEQKKNYCKVLFGLTDLEINQMFIVQNTQS